MENAARLGLAELDTKRGAEQGFEHMLKHPVTDDELPVGLRLLGFDADAYAAKVREQQKRRTDAMRRSRKNVPTPDDLESDAIDLLCAVTVGFVGQFICDSEELANLFGVAKGDPVPGTQEALRKFYRRFPAFREQADLAMSDRRNFTKASGAI